MNRFDAWFLHASTFLVGGSGLIYAWMRYLLEPADPFAVVNHPLQPQLQHLHVWLAPLLVFGGGLIWRQHAWKHWRRNKRQRRWSGSHLMVLLVPMIASGYLLQTAVGDGWRKAWIVIHLAASGIWLAAYLVHLLSPKPRRRRTDRGRRFSR